MKGLLIVNQFVTSDKFCELYRMLTSAAEKEGIALDLRRTGELPHSVARLGRLPYDFVLFWDKDTVLAQMLEAAGNRLFNTARAVELCDNKALTALALERAGLPAPDTLVAPLTFEGLGYTDDGFLNDAAAALGFPMIVKEAYGSFGQQVYLVLDRAALDERVAALGHKPFLMQRFVAESAGRDLRINVVGDRAMSCMLRYNDNDFRSNISNGGRMRAFAPTPEQEALAVAAARAVGADFAGVDVLFGKDGPLVCEVNSNPHFKSTLECTGVDMSHAILAHIAKALSR